MDMEGSRAGDQKHWKILRSIQKRISLIKSDTWDKWREDVQDFIIAEAWPA